MAVIPFNKLKIEKYLDQCIIYWRGKRNNAKTHEDTLIANCYIDAFQSVRTAIFDKELPK